MKKRILLLILGLFLISLAIGLYLFLFENEDFLSPLSNKSINLQKRQNKKQVIGFLPFWTIKDAESFDYKVLDQIIYMGVEFDENGEIIKRVEDYLEPSWSGFQSERFLEVIRRTKKENNKVLLGIQSYSPETIESILSNKNIQEKIITQTILLLKEKELDGVNLDFEYNGTNNDLLKRQFTDFARLFAEEIKKENQNYRFSIDVYADTIRKNRIYDIKGLSSFSDQIIIMGYDFHRASSVSAGPVAPLRSNSPYSILSVLNDFFQNSDREKLILAVPYYGYEWPTLNQEFGSPVYGGTGALATYKRTIALIEEEKLEVFWDEVSMTPWLTYKDQGKIKQIYFENERSLSLKYSLINQADLGGVAIWALGYDGERKELWNLLEKYFK